MKALLFKLALTSVLLPISLVATAASSQTKSVSAPKATWEQTNALETLKATTEIPNELVGLTREQVSTFKQDQQNNIAKPLKAASVYHREFSIYQGFAQLIEDYDEDGFYQTFSVTFDADVYNHGVVDSARVYAELYLSKDGGDWIHYYTTENFSIYGESEDDEYQVYTTLNQGYIPAHYDVLIDLYQVGYSDIVATYSAYDTNDLYALPLESTDYDPDYVEVIYESESHGHGGSIYSLLVVLLMAGFVKLRTKQQ